MKLIIYISLTLLMVLKIILSNKIVKNPYLEGSRSKLIFNLKNKIKFLFNSKKTGQDNAKKGVINHQ
jgi:hypothetical protein